MDKLATVFGRRIRGLRQARHMTQEALGHAAGIDYKHLSAIERGAKTPSFDAVEKLAGALGVEYWQLFLPDRRQTASLEKEINQVIGENSQIERADIDEFLRALRSAIRKLDRKRST